MPLDPNDPFSDPNLPELPELETTADSVSSELSQRELAAAIRDLSQDEANSTGGTQAATDERRAIEASIQSRDSLGELVKEVQYLRVVAEEIRSLLG